MKRKIILPAFALCLSASIAFAGGSPASLLERYPVSFNYDGKPFSAGTWKPEAVTKPLQDITAGAGSTGVVSYLSPDGMLRFSVTCVSWDDAPVVELRPVLECVSGTATGTVSDFKSLDFSRECGKGVNIRRITGSASAYTDFTRQDVLLQHRHECDRLLMTTSEGRSSAWLPFFGMDFSHDEGLDIALGWTGSWRAEFRHLGDSVRMFTSLVEGTGFKMLPGERFIMPYVVIYERHGKSLEEGQVEFHRFLINHKAPRDASGELFRPLLPVTCGGGNKSDDTMMNILSFVRDESGMPFDTFWVDANWYGPSREVNQDTNCGDDWYLWVGDWRVNTVTHPDGNLKKVSDAVHAAGMRFLLWFEPERGALGTPVMEEHPEYFHQEPGNVYPALFLLDLGNPEAFNWIVEEVSRNIIENGVDIYRQDFNMNPLPVWRAMDAPDRRGVSEIKHINGLWAFWDELHRRFPDMMFENCASGGTRMDIEMMSRAHSYCRDDAHMFADCDELTQNITLNTTPYLPFTGGETFTVPVGDTYAFFSRLGAGTVFTPTDFDGMFLTREPEKAELEWFRRMFGVAERIRPYFFGDFYRLTDNVADGSDIYCGYQLNDPDSGDGFFMVFRRKDCRDANFWLRLRGIDPGARYVVEEFEGRTRRMRGSRLMNRILTFDEPRSYKLVFYRKLA